MDSKSKSYKTLLRKEKNYPYLLSQISDAPEKIYLKGELKPEDRIAIAIVGSRRSTPQGQNIAYEMAYQLASLGITVVSGLAQGIDAKAHEGALDAGGRTVAVLGTGVDVVFPEMNLKLFERIPGQGALLSEFEPGTPAYKNNFPQRNRIISGLSLGTLVVEAWERSGALITARLALEQNREVWAVPGPISSQASRGTNLLIQSGAKLVISIDDILEDLNITRETTDELRKSAGLSESEEKILRILDISPQDMHNLVAKSGLEAKEINTCLSFLELKGLIKNIGNNFALNK